MVLDNKTVFLAGAAGMTGSSILSCLLRQHPTTQAVACCRQTEPCVRSGRVRTVYGDLRSLEECRRMVHGCDVGIMAAAYAGGAGFTTTSPFDHTRENLQMNWALLEAFYQEGVRRIVFIGSSAIYQAFDGSIKEDELDMNRDPHEAYFGFGWAMRFLEKMGLYLHRRYGFEVILVRAANIFGPRDKFDPARSNVIPALIRKAVDRMDPFEVWGSPDVVRDAIFCDDVADAVVRLADADSIRCDAFNLGSGVRTRVGDIVTWALDAAGHSPSQGIRYVGDKPTTIGFRALDCSKVQQAVGWRPAHTIEEGIRETTRWWTENKESWRR
jgi:nucleoside-diphosphate-sugar epimerase